MKFRQYRTSFARSRVRTLENRKLFTVSFASAPLASVLLSHAAGVNFEKMTQVTGTGGEEAPTPTPAPVDAPEQTPAPTPAPAAGVGGLVGAIKNAVTGHGDSSSGDDAVATAAQPADGAADGAHGMLGNLTSSISSAAHNVTDAATSTISHAAHSVTDAASGLIGGKKDDAAAPAAGDAPAADKEGRQIETSTKHGSVWTSIPALLRVSVEITLDEGLLSPWVGKTKTMNERDLHHHDIASEHIYASCVPRTTLSWLGSCRGRDRRVPTQRD